MSDQDTQNLGEGAGEDLENTTGDGDASTENSLDNMSYEELKQHAEDLEKQVKDGKDDDKDAEKRANQIARIKKAEAKLAQRDDDTHVQEPTRRTEPQVSVPDQVTLAKHDIDEKSPKAQVLKQFKDAGLIENYKDGLEDSAVKAKFAEIDAKENAEDVLDEAEQAQHALDTRKDIHTRHRTTGDVPTDPDAQKKLAEDNLKGMGI